LGKAFRRNFDIRKREYQRRNEKERGNNKSRAKVSQFRFIIPRREEKSKLTVGLSSLVEAKEGSGFQKRGETVTVEAS